MPAGLGEGEQLRPPNAARLSPAQAGERVGPGDGQGLTAVARTVQYALL